MSEGRERNTTATHLGHLIRGLPITPDEWARANADMPSVDPLYGDPADLDHDNPHSEWRAMLEHELDPVTRYATPDEMGAARREWRRRLGLTPDGPDPDADQADRDAQIVHGLTTLGFRAPAPEDSVDTAETGRRIPIGLPFLPHRLHLEDAA